MSQCISLLLAFLIYRAHDVVFAKPGFDEVPALSLNGFRYSHELHRQYHLDNGIEFVKKQISKASSLNTNVAKNAILFLGDGMSGELQFDLFLANNSHFLNIDSCLLFLYLTQCQFLPPLVFMSEAKKNRYHSNDSHMLQCRKLIALISKWPIQHVPRQVITKLFNRCGNYLIRKSN